MYLTQTNQLKRHNKFMVSYHSKRESSTVNGPLMIDQGHVKWKRPWFQHAWNYEHDREWITQCGAISHIWSFMIWAQPTFYIYFISYCKWCELNPQPHYCKVYKLEPQQQTKTITYRWNPLQMGLILKLGWPINIES